MSEENKTENWAKQLIASAPWTERERDIIGAAIKMSVGIESAMGKLNGLMPLLKLKTDEDLYYLLDEVAQRCLTEVAVFESHMRSVKPPKPAVTETVPQPLMKGIPPEIRIAGGPQPEDFVSFDHWVLARRVWVNERMTGKLMEKKP